MFEKMRYIAHLTRHHIFHFSSHLSDDVQKCATVDHMSDISSINKSIFGKKTRRRRLFFLPFSFYRPWPSYSTNHARLTDYFNASATQISKWRHWVSKHIHTYLYTFQIFYQKKGTRWICWHIHYVVVYQIIKLNKCLKDVKTTLSTLRQEIFFPLL